MASVEAWREAVALMAKRNMEAVESVDSPLEEDSEGICVPGCGGVTDARCVCKGNVAEPGGW